MATGVHLGMSKTKGALWWMARGRKRVCTTPTAINRVTATLDRGLVVKMNPGGAVLGD